MAQFLLFAGNHYYPAAGFGNLIGVRSSQQECISLLLDYENRETRTRLDWAHIVMIEENKVELLTAYRWEDNEWAISSYAKEFFSRCQRDYEKYVTGL